MQKKRYKKGKGNIVEQADAQIKIFAQAERFINVKDKRRQTHGSKMQNKRRPAALLKQNEDADAKPDYTY